MVPRGPIGASAAAAIALVTLLLFRIPARAASFECRAATTLVETLICNNGHLSEQDERVAFAYRSVLQSAARPDDVRASQRQWLRLLARCSDAECINSAQATRLAQLEGKHDPDTPIPTRVGDTIPIGGHVSITITAIRGIGTRVAEIDARMTERNAVVACHEYIGESIPTRKCIADWMKEGGGTVIVEYRADCTTGVIRIGRSRAAFVGRNAAASIEAIEEPEYLVRLLDTGELLQNMNASGYPVFLHALQSLCPGILEHAPQVRR